MKRKGLYLALVMIFAYGQIFSQNYASMYLANSSTDLITGTLLAGNWQQLTGFTAMENHTNWSFSSDSLTASSSAAGSYLISYSLSFEATPGIWLTTVMVNGVEQTELSNGRKIATGGQDDVGNIGGCGFIEISDGDVITFEAKSDVDADKLTPIHAQVTLIELDEDFSPDYAEMYISDNSVSQQPGTSFAKINNFTAGALEGWTFGTNELIASSGSAGKYLALYSISFSGDGPEEYEYGISLNGSNPDKILLQRRLSSNSDVGNAVASGILTIAQDDAIAIYGRSFGTNKDIIPTNANLSLIKIASADNANEYGNMFVTNNSNAITVSTAATWYKETNFAQTFTPSSNWSFDSANDHLIAGADAPGDYLVSYHLGITLSVDASVTAKVAVFVNDIEQTKTSRRRTLPNNKNDIGSISGSGIITIANSNDKVTLRLQNLDNTTDLLVKEASVNLFRIKETPPVPVELVSFDADENGHSVLLNWQTATEINNYGFEIERALQGSKIWEKIGFVEGHGNSNSPKNYSFIDTTPPNGVVQYRLKQIDTDGSSEYSEVKVVEGNREEVFKLSQNHPNPFNPATKISFSIPQLSRVSITVYNSIGQEIAELVNADFSAGNHSVDFDGSNLTTGMYFYTLRSAGYVRTMKMMLIK